MKDLEHLAKLINSYPSDIKAEVLMADLVQEVITPSEFLIFFESMFKRKFSRDILKADTLSVNDQVEVLAVYLARDGIYDLLPEGLFHDSPTSGLESGKEMAYHSRKESKVEAEARKFFRPFENEFFYQRIQLEIQERTTLQKFNENGMDDFFLDFWKIDSSLPRELSIRLTSMLPFVKDIIGDFNLTAHCLAIILGEEVGFSVHHSNELKLEFPRQMEDNEFSLGSANLGMNMVTSGHSIESRKLIRFHIGPLKRTETDPYLENGEITRFIDCFCNFFIPMEIDVEFDVVTQKSGQEFILDSENKKSVLGYNTIL